MMNNLIKGMGLMAACVLAWTLPVYAATESVSMKAAGNKAEVVLELRQTGVSDNQAYYDEIHSLQLGFHIEPKQKQGTVSFEFAEGIQSEVKTHRYQEDTGNLNIYISGQQDLFDVEEGRLSLGKVVLKDLDAKNDDVVIYVQKDSLKVVNAAYSMQTIQVDVPEKGVVVGKSAAESSPIPGKPDTPGTPSRPGATGTVTPSVTETPTPSVTPGVSETPMPSMTPTPSAAPTATMTPIPSATGRPVNNTKTPKAPKVTKVTNTASGITVKWSKVSNATGYYVWRKAPGKKWTKIATIKGTNIVSYTDKTAKKKDGVKYSYSIQAYSNGKTSGYSKTGESAVRMRAPSLSKPKAKGSGTMLVKWKRNTEADGYVIQYSRSSDFKKNLKKVRIRSGKTIQTTVSDLKEGKVHYVRIRSYKKVGGKYSYSAWGNAKKVKIG